MCGAECFLRSSSLMRGSELLVVLFLDCGASNYILFSRMEGTGRDWKEFEIICY